MLGDAKRETLYRGVFFLSLLAISVFGSLFLHTARNVDFNSPILLSTLSDNDQNLVQHKHQNKCQQPPELIPPPSNLYNASHFLTSEYRNLSAELLAGAVRIPTESFDDMNQNPLEEPRFEIFTELLNYLADKFPLVSEHVEYINTYGLLYTLTGTDKSLKPLVLMAHQDVVPVEQNTMDHWTHGPFSGHFDGTYIWGRGSVDDKSSLIGILEATESLLQQNHQFNRTVILSFGFDEELDGSRGAGSLADTLRQRYGGEDSLYMIIDEGSGISEVGGSLMGQVGVTEKGYTDINIIVTTPGGHSSAPPDHTGIGITSKILVELENSHITSTRYQLGEKDVVAQYFSCAAQYASNLTDTEREVYNSPAKLKDYLKSDIELRPVISTTQAIDVISGGVKINALPEQVTTTINYRIDVHESVQYVTDGVKNVVLSVAKKMGLGLRVNNNTIVSEAGRNRGTIDINNGQSIEPAPVSPYNLEDEQWQLIAGTTKHVIEEWFDLQYAATVPLAEIGNTDTYQYVGLTPHVYRYAASLPYSGASAHTVNEFMSLESHLSMVAWYYELLQFM